LDLALLGQTYCIDLEKSEALHKLTRYEAAIERSVQRSIQIFKALKTNRDTMHQQTDDSKMKSVS
jgi:hypothetical protein